MREVLAQGLAFQVIGKEQPPRVRVTGEIDSEHLRRFALVPLRRPVEVRDTFRPGASRGKRARSTTAVLDS